MPLAFFQHADDHLQLNVLVDPEPRALLCDFGLSRMVNPEGVTTGLTTTGITVSIRYASPELMNGSRQTIESDMWAWACLFLEVRSIPDLSLAFLTLGSDRYGRKPLHRHHGFSLHDPNRPGDSAR